MKSRRTSETRNQYLINYRNGLWTQIRAKEDSVWRFIAYFAGALLLLLNFGLDVTDFNNPQSRIKIVIISTLLIIASFWGLLITLDANFWFQRNLIIIRNIENNLLYKRDFGLIIPNYFGEPHQHYQYTSFTDIQNLIFTFSITTTLLVILFFSQNQDSSVGLLVLLQLSGCFFSYLLLLVIDKNMNYVNRLFDDQISAPGKSSLSNKEMASKDEFLIETLRKSGLEAYFSIITFFGMVTYTTIFYNNAELIDNLLSKYLLFGKPLTWASIIILLISVTAIALVWCFKKQDNFSDLLKSQVKPGKKAVYFLRTLILTAILVSSAFVSVFLIIHSVFM